MLCGWDSFLIQMQHEKERMLHFWWSVMHFGRSVLHLARSVFQLRMRVMQSDAVAFMAVHEMGQGGVLHFVSTRWGR